MEKDLEANSEFRIKSYPRTITTIFIKSNFYYLVEHETIEKLSKN